MNIFAKRWYVRVLAHLYDHNGARFVVMKHALGINADSLTRTLKALIDEGWVERNPGYGHPLRPEYILSDSGRVLAERCSRFDTVVDTLQVASTVYHKWSVPTLIVIDHGVSRFNALREQLAITPRALTQSLERLCLVALVEQRDGYRTTVPGRRIAQLAERLDA